MGVPGGEATGGGGRTGLVRRKASSLPKTSVALARRVAASCPVAGFPSEALTAEARSEIGRYLPNRPVALCEEKEGAFAHAGSRGRSWATLSGRIGYSCTAT